MNNHHRMSKRKRQAILFFTYGFMTLAIIVISVICLMLIMGYRFNVSDRTIEQGGLLQFRSTPAGAQVFVNDRLLSSTTPTKNDVPAGIHTVKMQRANYHPWSRSVPVKAGELRWLNYARLVPTKIKTTPVLTFSRGASAGLVTPDRRFLAVIPNRNQPAVEIVDLRNDENIQSTPITIPAEQLSVQDGQISEFSIAEWDFGSRFLLITHRNGDTFEYIRVDRSAETGDARNITKEFNLPFKDMHFSGTSGNVLYGLTNNDIRRVDTAGGSVTQPLISGVESYRLYRENDISFIALRSDKRIAGVYIDNKETIVRSIPADQPIQSDLSRYYSHYYLAVTTPAGVDIIKDPAEVGEATVKTHASMARGSHSSQWIDFGSSGRFIVNGDATAYSVYDLETDERYSVAQSVLINSQMLPTWLDDYYFVSTSGGSVKLFEYDGLNSHAIASAVDGLPVFLSQDGTFLYSFVERDGVRSLQSSRLILN